jgi:hypothetical protein
MQSTLQMLRSINTSIDRIDFESSAVKMKRLATADMS